MNADQHLYLTFESRRIEVLDGRHGRIAGDLTIRGITRPVVLEVEYNGMSKSPWGTTSAGFSAFTTLNRKNWNWVCTWPWRPEGCW